jgi:protein-L-isoaspartate(D-aspartate) O-methyltransferase
MALFANDRAVEREAMIQRQLKQRGIEEPYILEAFRAVPRELFVSSDLRRLAYSDQPLPIEAEQTISQPYIVALMIQAAGVKSSDHVLEVGAGSGYAAAVIGRIAARVVAIERQATLVPIARERMDRLGYSNVEIVEGDGTLGWPDGAPFDAILAAASGSHVPQALMDQLAPGGRIVMPLGNAGSVQQLIKATKQPDGNITREDLGPVRFVPLIGEEGWSDAGS